MYGVRNCRHQTIIFSSVNIIPTATTQTTTLSSLSLSLSAAAA